MFFRNLSCALPVLVFVSVAVGEQRFSLKRCELVPLPGQQVSFQIDGVEQTRWHFGASYPRPFLYPLLGPSGSPLTRMGHPGAPNHDHHRSIWFAHHDVEGSSFWADGRATQIRHKGWLAYVDGDAEAIMASSLAWRDPTGTEIMEQEVVIAIIPLADQEYLLELQSTFRPAEDRDTVTLGKTNFGFLAVRVAKTLSEHFGGGQLTSSEGGEGEKAIFGRSAAWMDYSGPMRVVPTVRQSVANDSNDASVKIEGITFFDHPTNPRYPSPWHVRADGWMGASFCMHEQRTISRDKPLALRYLLHIHGAAYSKDKATQIHQHFSKRPHFVVSKGTRSHHQYHVQRATDQ